MKSFDVAHLEETLALEERLRASAAATVTQLKALVENNGPLAILEVLRFTRSGCDPLDSSRALNFIEQLNQTFTYLVSLRAIEFLFHEHPEAAPFHVNLGTAAGSDVEGADGSVAAEVFAAVDPRNNRKLERDVARLAATEAEHQYVFFYTPGSHEPSQRQRVKIIPVELDRTMPPLEGNGR